MPHPLFPCEDCINNTSPVCEVCVTRTNQLIPTHFIHHREVHLLADKTSPKASIERCLATSKPIPIAWVMAYNRIIDKTEDGG